MNDSYVRKAFAELGLDYEKQSESFANYEIKGEDTFCKKPISEPRRPARSGSTAKASLPFSCPACTLGAYADFKAKGKKINMAYVFDRRAASSCSPTRPSMPRKRQERDRAVPPEEGRRSARGQDRRQGRQLRRSAQVGVSGG